MTDDKTHLEEQLTNLMNINDQNGPPRFIADSQAREQWIADTVNAAAVDVEPEGVRLMDIAPPTKRSRMQGLTPMAIGFGIAVGLAVVIAALFWPIQSDKNENANIGQRHTEKVAPKENLKLTVVISDQGFHFDANPNIRTPWSDHGPSPTVPEYTTPHIPKKDGDWDYAELKRRLRVLKDVHKRETSIILEAKSNMPYGVLIDVMDNSRDNAGKPLFPDVMLKHVAVSWRIISVAVVHYPRGGQEPDESLQNLNLAVAIADNGFHFKVSPKFRMPWMDLSKIGSHPGIPKKGNEWDFVEFQRLLRELKDNHRDETSIILGAEKHIPFGVFFKAVEYSAGTSKEPLFPDVMLTRLVE